jgi:hypothetical protein
MTLFWLIMFKGDLADAFCKHIGATLGVEPSGESKHNPKWKSNTHLQKEIK